jgi:hypothetical protein
MGFLFSGFGLIGAKPDERIAIIGGGILAGGLMGSLLGWLSARVASSIFGALSE